MLLGRAQGRHVRVTTVEGIGRDADHASLFEGKTPVEIEQMRRQMDAHVRRMIADQV
jgi:hypothetical protein